MTKLSLLTSLVMLIAQPILGMHADQNTSPKKIRRLAQERTPEIQQRLNELLIAAAEKNNLVDAQKYLDCNAEVNTRGGDMNWTPLMEACASRSKLMCQLLLTYGADISIECDTRNNALEIAASRDSRSLCKLLIIQATFNCPRPSAIERQTSVDFVFTFLLALKRMYPRLPKEIRYMLLSATKHSRAQVMNTAFGIHRAHPERIPFLPITTVQKLINGGIIHQETAIKAIKDHNSAHIIPLLDDARIIGGPWELLDPNRFEENFGAQIAEHTKLRLEQT